MRIRVLACFTLVASCGLGFAQSAAVNSGKYTYTSISAPSATSTEVHGINNAGVMVGQFTDSAGMTHGFTASAGVFTTIDVAGAVLTRVQGINNSGEIVGTYMDAAGLFHGFHETNGNITILDVPGASATQAYGINDSGLIVGGFADSLGQHGFLDRNSIIRTLDVGTHNFTVATGLNNAEQIVGYYNAGAGATVTFLSTAGQIRTIKMGNAAVTEGLGIDNASSIVGIAGTQTKFQSFTNRGGRFSTARIKVPGSFETQAEGINDSGQLVGWYYVGTQPTQGFLAVPERAYEYGDFSSTTDRLVADRP